MQIKRYFYTAISSLTLPPSDRKSHFFIFHLFLCKIVTKATNRIERSDENEQKTKLSKILKSDNAWNSLITLVRLIEGLKIWFNGKKKEKLIR